MVEFWKIFLTIFSLPTFKLIVCLDDSPCQRYQILDMHDGQRHVDYVPQDPAQHQYICDKYGYLSDSWYRLVYDEENFKLATECLPINSCGTLAPIWMVGNYTSQAGVTVENYLCSNYGDGGSGQCSCTSEYSDGHIKVDVQLCEDGHGGDFYIHRFDDIPGCTVGFCVENHPTGVNVYEGDILRCDEKDSHCTSVTVALETEITSFSTAIVNCNFFDDIDQKFVMESIWKSPTTVQCQLPTADVNGETRRIYGLFRLEVVQTGDSSEIKQRMEVVIYDSTCQTCDESNNCILKDGMCFVNGQCCHGSQCALCETIDTTATTETTTSIDSASISTQMQGEEDAVSVTTPKSTSEGFTQEVKTPLSTSEQTSASKNLTTQFPEDIITSTQTQGPNRRQSLLVPIMLPILLILIIVTMVVGLVWVWRRRDGKVRENSTKVPPPGPYMVTTMCPTPVPSHNLNKVTHGLHAIPPPYEQNQDQLNTTLVCQSQIYCTIPDSTFGSANNQQLCRPPQNDKAYQTLTSDREYEQSYQPLTPVSTDGTIRTTAQTEQNFYKT